MSLPAGTGPAKLDHESDEDARHWQEAKVLRTEHRGWVVIWLAAEAEFRAYRRMPGARRDTVLRAATASGMKARIKQAEVPARSGGKVQA